MLQYEKNISQAHLFGTQDDIFGHFQRQRQETDIQDLDHKLQELNIVQLQLQSSNVIHYCLSPASSLFYDVGSNKGVPTSGSFTVSVNFIQIIYM